MRRPLPLLTNAVKSPVARFVSCSFLVVTLLIPSGCRPSDPNSAPDPQPAGGYPKTIVIERGNTLLLDKEPKRLVSLAPSYTEILFALGLGDRVVGVTSACDYPPEAKQKPTISGALGKIDMEKILAATPDLVLGVPGINQETLDALKKVGIPTLALDIKTVNDVSIAISLVGQATGTESNANALIATLANRFRALDTKMQAAKTRPKVLIMYGVSPIYTTGPGSFIDEAITKAGGKNIVAQKVDGNVISSEVALIRQPNVILCSVDLQVQVRRLPGWAKSVPAVRDNRFYSPGDALVRPGPRLADGVEQLARFLHPELFDAASQTPKAAQKVPVSPSGAVSHR